MDTVLTHTTLLLNRRGYETTKTIKNEPSAPVGKKTPQLQNSTLYGLNEKTGEEIICYFVEHVKVTIDIIKTILSTSKIKNILIIYAKSLTPDAKQAINVNKLFCFEIFSFDELSYDPISIVPEHVKLEEKPKEWHKFPIILSTDMIARYYGFKRGDVIAIIEDTCLNYRKCV